MRVEVEDISYNYETGEDWLKNPYQPHIFIITHFCDNGDYNLITAL